MMDTELPMLSMRNVKNFTWKVFKYIPVIKVKEMNEKDI